MKKIKKLWTSNRVMFVLAIIVVVCIFIIFGVMLKYFFGTAKSSYGDRLEDIASLPFKEEDKNKIIDSLSGDHTMNVSVDVKGKIVYIMVEYDGEVSLVEAQNKVVDVYQQIDGSYKKHYDFITTVSQDPTIVNAYTLLGSKNVSSDNFIWSNNTPVTSGE